LEQEVHEYAMETKGSAAKVDQLRRSVLAPETLELKEGAEVMFVANNPSGGFVNGTRGRVVDFRDGQPVVHLASNRNIKVAQHSWKLEEDGRVRAEVAQLPLRLAWAITIHKSQGMSLDAAEIDLSKSFTPGMGYVALSRIRSIDGLYLSGINAMALQMHPAIYEFDRDLRKTSAALAATTPDAPEPDPAEPEVVSNPKLLAALKSWRMATAQAASIPAYVIAHDSVLELVALKLPASSQALLGLKGFGTAKVEKYGDDILQLVAKHNPRPTTPELPTIDAVKSSEEIAAHRQATIAQYPRAFRHWEPAEEALLMDLFQQGMTLDQCCAILERQPSGLWARLQSLLTSQK
jgi:ATP-dependent DNA helicase PIF1